MEPHTSLRLNPEAVDQAVRSLDSRNVHESAQAEHLLKEAGSLAVEPLLAGVREEAAQRTRRHRAGFLALALTVAAVLTALWGRGNGSLGSNATGCFLLLGFLGLCLLAWAQESGRADARRRALLMTVDDRRVIGPLIESVRSPGGVGFRESVTLLTHLLPQLQASDAALITDSHRAHFYYVLKHYRHFEIGPLYGTDYLLAVLKALEQVGDARSLPVVERIAGGEAAHGPVDAGVRGIRRLYNGVMARASGTYRRAVDWPRVEQAARDCLPTLRERVAQESPVRTLLRPTAAAAPLVQPAPPPSLDAAALVRPTIQNQANGGERPCE